MKSLNIITIAALLLGTASVAQAQEPHIVYDQVRGELSPGTQAPTREALVNTLRGGAAGDIMAMLEYGERLECHECVPIVERLILEHTDAQVREFAAWWIRHRIFAIGAVNARMKRILATDADPVRRARAAAALGEFLIAQNLPALQEAYRGDDDAGVRSAVVHALGRLNHPGGNATIAAAFSDSDAGVRIEALSNVLKVNFFREHDALIAVLADDEGEARRRSALLVGEFGVTDAVPALTALLAGDSDRNVRQAAAWALGRIGGAEANAALGEALTTESDSLVLDAIRIAQAM